MDQSVFADHVSSTMLHALLPRDDNEERICRKAISRIQRDSRTFYTYAPRIGSLDMSRCSYWLEARDVDLEPLRKYQTFHETSDWQYNKARSQGNALSNQPALHKSLVFNTNSLSILGRAR